MMKTIKSKGIVALTSLAALALAACGSPASDGGGSEDGFSWTYNSYDPGTQAQMRAMEIWAEDMPDVLGVPVDVEFFFSEGLIKATDTLEAVGAGRADIAYLASAYFPAQLPLGNIGGIPFLTNDPEAQSRALMKVYQEYEPFREEFHKNNVHLLNVSALAENIIASKNPVPTPADLAGVSMRTYGQLEAAVLTLGANPVSLAQPEVYESLERGVIDATSGASIDSAVARSYQEIAPHFIDPGTGNFAFVGHIMNLDTWNSLTEEQQQAINEYHSDSWVDKAIEQMMGAEDEACEALQEENGTVTIWTDEEVEAWKNDVGSTILDTWADRAREAGVEPEPFHEALMAAYEEFLSTSKYVSGMARCAEAIG